MFLLGLDIGGTKTEAALISDNPYEIIAKKRIPTCRDKGYTNLLNHIQVLIREILQKVPSGTQIPLGIGLPGTVDPQTQHMKRGNTGFFAGKDIRKDIAALLPELGPISCANDANCFLLAEAKFGVGAKGNWPVENPVGVGIILGTGVGGGFAIGDQVVAGASGSFAELGHTNLINNGLHCYCDRRGCAEQYISGPGFEASFARRQYSQIEGKPKAQEIFELALKDPIAKSVVNEYKYNLRNFLVNICTTLDPHYIVLGGGMSLQECIYIDLEKEVKKRIFVDHDIKILQHTLGDSAGVIGAAFLNPPIH